MNKQTNKQTNKTNENKETRNQAHTDTHTLRERHTYTHTHTHIHTHACSRTHHNSHTRACTHTHITSHHITTQGNASQHGAVRTIIHSRCTLRTRGGVSNKSDKNKTPAALFHPPYPIGLCHNVTANLGRKNPHTFAAQLRLASAPPMLGISGRCAVQKIMSS